MDHLVKWFQTCRVLLCSDATHKPHLCTCTAIVHITFTWTVSKAHALLCIRSARTHTICRSEIVSEEDNWECLNCSCSEQSVQNLSAPKPEKPRLQAESWCKICLSLQRHNLGTCTWCKFNPGPKVSCFNDINNFWCFLSCPCPPHATLIRSSWKNSAVFDGSLRRQEGAIQICKDELWFAGVVGMTLRPRRKEGQGIIIHAKLMMFGGFCRPPRQMGIWNSAGKPGWSAAGMAWLPCIVCGRSWFSDWEQEVNEYKCLDYIWGLRFKLIHDNIITTIYPGLNRVIHSD